MRSRTGVAEVYGDKEPCKGDTDRFGGDEACGR